MSKQGAQAFEWELLENIRMWGGGKLRAELA